jgi:hypothetical protein
MKYFILFMFNLMSYSTVFCQVISAPPPPPPPPPAEETSEEVINVEDFPEPEFSDQAVSEEVVVELYRGFESQFKYEEIGYRSGIYYYYNPLESNNEYGSTKYGVFKNGKSILPPIFHKGYYEENKTIILGIDNQFGLYDCNTEKWIIPLMYSKLQSIGGNNFIANLNGKHGIIDHKNNVLADFRWQRMEKSYGGDNYFIVSDKSNVYGVYNVLTNMLAVPCVYKQIQQKGSTGFFVTREDNLVNIVDFNNRPVFKTWYEHMIFSEARPNIIVKKDGLYGVIDMLENIIVPFDYTEWKSYPYSDGSYLVKNKKGKYGCILIDGRISLPFEYDLLKESGGNNLLSTKGLKCGIVQVGQGLPNEIVTCDYEDIKFVNNNYIFKKTGKYGVLDRFGKVVIAPEFKNIEVVQTKDNYQYKDLYITESGKGFSLYNSEGRLLNNTVFKSLTPLFQKDLNGYGDKIVFLKFENTENKKGLLDFAGIEVLPATYDDITQVKDNKIVFRNGNKYGAFSIISKKSLASDFDNILITKEYWIGMKGSDYFRLDINQGVNHKKL